MLAGDCKVCGSLPFMEAPEWGNYAMPEQRLRQVWHRRDLVRLMDRIRIIVVGDKGGLLTAEWPHKHRHHGTESRHLLA